MNLILLLKRERTNIMIAVIIILILVLILTIYIDRDDSKKNNDFVYMFKNTNWATMTERETEYTAMLYNVLNTFSYQEDPIYKKSMTRDQRINYTSLNGKLAQAFGYGYYWIPAIHQLESAFNPYQKHLFGEIGMAGIMYATAVTSYQFCKKYMPGNLFRLVDFNLEKSSDLEDPINALKMTYMIVWNSFRDYGGYENWAISGYHLGGFLYKHFNDDPEDFPELFIIYTKYGKMEFNPKKYYFNWRQLNLAYENGDLESGKIIQEKWDKFRDEMGDKEYKYRSARDQIRKLTKLLQEKNEIEQQQKDKYIEIEKQVMKLSKKLDEIGGKANKEGWSKTIYNNFKTEVKSFIAEVHK